MSTRRFKTSRGGLVLLLVSTAVLGLPSIGAAQADLTVVKVTSIASGLNPADPAWNSALPASIPLINRLDWPDRHIFVVAPGRTYTLKAIHDGQDLYVRFEWADATQNTAITDVPTYPDGCAIQFPMWDWTNPCTPAFGENMFMGFFGWDPNAFAADLPPFDPATCSPPYNLVTNIMMWKANLGNKPQNIMAQGEMGTVHRTGPNPEGFPPVSTPGVPVAQPYPPFALSPTQNITSSQNWAAGRWTVILKRPMASVDPNAQFDFAGRIGAVGVPFALANWDGQLQERANRKFATGQWYHLDVQP